MAKISISDVFAFYARHAAGIAAALGLEEALRAKPRDKAKVRKCALSLIAAEAPNVNTSDQDLRAAIDKLVAALDAASQKGAK